MRSTISGFSLAGLLLCACAEPHELPCPLPAPTEFGALEPGAPGVRVSGVSG